MTDSLLPLLSGLGTNLLICIIACVHPMLVGMIVLLVKRGRPVGRISPAWYIAECVPPIALLMALFYGIMTRSSAFIVTVLVLTIAHTAYIPVHIRETYSVRNYFAAAVDLFSSLLKWSLAASFITVVEILRAAQIYNGRHYTPEVYIVVCVIVFVLLLLLQGAKQMILRIGRKGNEGLPAAKEA